MFAAHRSLLAPGIEMAAASKNYGSSGEFAFVPVALGFILGAAFVYASDLVISHSGVDSPVAFCESYIFYFYLQTV